MSTKRSRADASLRSEHAMVDAIREIMGLGPLYAEDPRQTEAERFAPRQLQSDGGGRVTAFGGRHWRE